MRYLPLVGRSERKALRVGGSLLAQPNLEG
ncbi:MAG: hypothetical protein QOF03_478 [Alphaproteobacteria bacterium]|jgi:hypothetical protein|nr:hypothetical protein [Alphaproteobacteria bacterium]